MLLKWANSVAAIFSRPLNLNFHRYSSDYSLRENKRPFTSQQPKNYITEEDFNYYYRPKMSQIDERSREIINQMKQKNLNKQKLLQVLDSYLDFSKNRRSPAGLLVILTAMWESKGDDIWRKNYIKKITEFILRSYDISVFKLDRRNFPLVVKSLCIRIHETPQKIKIGLVKSKLVQLISANIDVLRPHELYTILEPLTDLANEGTMSEKLKFVKLADIIQEKIHKFLMRRLRNETTQVQNASLTIYSLKGINAFYKTFTPKNKAYVQSLYKILEKLLFNDDQTNKFSFKIHKTRAYGFYSYFPHIGRNQKGQYYRDMLLNKILQKKNFRHIQNQQQYQWQNVLLCYNIACFHFFKTMDNLQFRYHQTLNYLIKEDVSPPQLHPFFWQYYSKRPEMVHLDAILYHIVKHIYPHKYIQTPQVNASTIVPFAAENQFKIRVAMALQKLGIKSQSQVKICERYVDFLIDGNIILEIDGLKHFEIHQMQYSQTTHFRNLHFLLSGYRLVIINIYEYTVNRYVQDLSALIKSKLDLIQTHNAILVI